MTILLDLPSMTRDLLKEQIVEFRSKILLADRSHDFYCAGKVLVKMTVSCCRHQLFQEVHP
jgi:hypothetical protein